MRVMQTPSRNVMRAMFDVRPLDENGRVSFDKLDSISETLSLRKRLKAAPRAIMAVAVSDPKKRKSNSNADLDLDGEPTEKDIMDMESVAGEIEQEALEMPLGEVPIMEGVIPDKGEEEKENIDDGAVAEVVEKKPSARASSFDKQALVDEFQNALLASADISADVAQFGGELHYPVSAKPRSRSINIPKSKQSKIYDAPENLPIVVLQNSSSKEPPGKASDSVRQLDLRKMEIPKEQAFDSFMAKKSVPASPAAREVEHFLEELRKNTKPVLAATSAVKTKIKRFSIPNWLKKKPLIIFAAIAVGGMFISGGISIKNDVLKKGDRALLNLQDAKANLENFDFVSAANHFALASKNFSEASNKLNLMGASVISLFSEVPGLGKIKTAKNMVKAGENISQAGEELADAFDHLSKTNFVSYFGAKDEAQKSLSEFIKVFRDSLVFAKDKIDDSQKLLASLDVSVLPEDKQQFFLDFKDKIPEFQKFVGGAVNYSDFLLEFVGTNGPRKYLVLFQNNSELRPTGGFPGTYGLLEFNGGYLKNIFVDDIYRIDGQIRENIIPPKEMQHITPTWGMRDANWWADFPTSARKVMDMYQKDGGATVDGVITFTPTVITRILEVVGPIDMPEYKMQIKADNFLSLVQAEVEYGVRKDDNSPKKIIMDFTPKFIERLAEQDRDNWFKIFQILVDGMVEKHILAYFSAPDLEKIVLENNFAGEVKKTSDDFLLVTYTNVKGSKTDAVTNNALDVQTGITDEGFIEHTLTITRTHTGGKTPYGFYNRQNSAYVRIMVPAGSELADIVGNTVFNPVPIMSYTDGNFRIDKELESYEAQARKERGIKTFSEAGKTVFGFWMMTDPGTTKKVTIKYLTPVKVRDDSYALYVQKQPGTQDKLNFNFVLPKEAQVIFRHPDNLQAVNGNMVLDSDLKTDRSIGVQWSR